MLPGDERGCIYFKYISNIHPARMNSIDQMAVSLRKTRGDALRGIFRCAFRVDVCFKHHEMHGEENIFSTNYFLSQNFGNVFTEIMT